MAIRGGIFAVALALLCVRSCAAVTPVSKTLQLLGSLEAKIVKEGEEAKATFEKFTGWCEDRSKNIQFEITTMTSESKEISASISKAVALISSCTSKVEEITSSIATNEADLQAACAIRDTEKADFVAAETELVDVIDALERAIAILQREERKHGASALLQLKGYSGVIQAVRTMVDAAMIGSQDAKVLTALVQNQQSSTASDAADDSDMDMGEPLGAPSAAAYEFKSGNIIDTLESLLEKAQQQLEDARQKETTAQHNFEMLKQSLTDEIKFLNKELAESKKCIAEQTEAQKTFEGDLSQTSESLSVQKKTASTLDQDCMTGSEDYQAAVKSREEELAAIRKAIQVLSETTGGAEDITYSSASFLQLDQELSLNLKSGVDLANFEVVRLVRKLAREENSQALAQLASRISAAMRFKGTAAGGDPFAKVKGLIEDMLAKLEKDAEQDASHKAYCDKEMGETASKKAEKEAEMDKLKTQIDQATASSAKLKEEVAEIQNNLAALAKAQAEMAKIRQEEKALFNKNKPEMEAGIEGVKMALKILREYYAKDDKAHSAAEGAGSSIIGLLEVVESDFSKTLANMEVAEAQAQSDFEMQSNMNAVEKKSMEQDVVYKTKEFKGLDKAVTEAKSDLDGVITEHEALLEYQSKLNEMCIAKPETYAERARRREAEIAGLKEALEILSGEAVLLQRDTKMRRKGGLRGATLAAGSA